MEFEIEDHRILDIMRRAKEDEITLLDALAEMEELYGVSLRQIPDLRDLSSSLEFYKRLEQAGISNEEYVKRIKTVSEAYLKIVEEKIGEVYTKIKNLEEIENSEE